MALEGYGKVIGSLEDTVIYAELAIDIVTLKMKIYDFRVVQFRYYTKFVIIKNLSAIFSSF